MYADGYQIRIGLTDVDLLFTRRGEEQVVVTLSMVLAKTLAQQLAEVVRLYEAQLEETLPTAQELEEKLRVLVRGIGTEERE